MTNTEQQTAKGVIARKKGAEVEVTDIVRTGHGANTTIGSEAPHLEEWIRRGY